MVNTGLITMYGKERSQGSRLRESVYKGDNEIRVEPGLDWKADDKIFLATSNMQWQHSEYRDLISYDSATGIAVLDEDLDFFHFGQDDSTGDDYSGVDMRTEVRLLTRNIKITGEDKDSWGCTILTNDRFESDFTYQ